MVFYTSSQRAGRKNGAAEWGRANLENDTEQREKTEEEKTVDSEMSFESWGGRCEPEATRGDKG